MLVRNGKSHYVTEFTTYKLHRLIVRSMHRLCVCVCLHFFPHFFSRSPNWCSIYLFLGGKAIFIPSSRSSLAHFILSCSTCKNWTFRETDIVLIDVGRKFAPHRSICSIDTWPFALVHNLRYKRSNYNQTRHCSSGRKGKTRKTFRFVFYEIDVATRAAHRPHHRRRTIHELLRKNRTKNKKNIKRIQQTIYGLQMGKHIERIYFCNVHYYRP